MFAKVMAWAIVTWKSGQMGMLKVFFAGCGAYICLSFAVLLVGMAILGLDRKYARRLTAVGTAARKYLELQTEDGSCEIIDSEEARLRRVSFIIVIYCSKDLELKYLVDEVLFDQIKIGDRLSITYEVRRLLGSSRLVEVKVGRHESERLTDDPGPP